MADSEYFMVSVKDSMGNDLVSYVAAKDLRQYSQMMSSEYGNIKVEAVTADEIPVDIIDQLKAE